MTPKLQDVAYVVSVVGTLAAVLVAALLSFASSDKMMGVALATGIGTALALLAIATKPLK